MESNVQIVQVGGVMFIGEMVMFPDRKIKNPRVIRLLPVSERGDVQILFQHLVGSPPEINVSQWLFYYDAPDAIARGYIESVTGLTLAKTVPKEVILPGRPQ